MYKSAPAISSVALAMIVLLFPSSSCGHDWPTYLGDVRRSGLSPERLTLPLQETWIYRSQAAPRPAWPEPAQCDVLHAYQNLRSCVAFDRAFQLVADADTVYFGSSADDQIHALDAVTGEPKWHFFTAGPIRFAPTLADRKIYAGSDDGVVYCLRASDGQLLWKCASYPTARYLPGNGRMISLWPVRTGIVVDREIVYFGAGLFPNEGVYLTACSAADGTLQWRQKINVSAQGYMLASPDRLYVPTGRSKPAVFNRANGQLLGQLPSTGGAYALLVDDSLISGPGRGEKGLDVAGATGGESFARFDGLRMVVDKDMAYLQSETKLVALNRRRYWEWSLQKHALRNSEARIEERIKKLDPKSADFESAQLELHTLKRRLVEIDRNLGASFLWSISCDSHDALIGTDGLLFVGGANKVTAIRTEDGKEQWHGSVSGNAYGLSVAHGRLLVSTDTGSIHCFAAVDSNLRVAPAPSSSSTAGSEQSDELCKTVANQIMQHSGIRKGYCLMLGCKTGQLAMEIAKMSELQIIVIEPDTNHASAARRSLAAAGYLGGRVTVHEHPPDHLPYPPYFANLIVSEQALFDGKFSTSARELLQVLRPNGGSVILVTQYDSNEESPLREWGEGVFPNWHSERRADLFWCSAVRESLAGAGEWTHTFAEPGNSASSGDRLVGGKMAVQWFGQPGPNRIVDRHFRNMPPLYKDGRLFVPGNDVLYAIDAYNGTILWQAETPGARRLGIFLDAAGMVVDENYLYLGLGDSCHRFDVRTGETNTAYLCPQPQPEKPCHWGYLARCANVLLGSGQLKGTTYRTITRDAQLYSEPVWYPNLKIASSLFLFGIQEGRTEPLWIYQSGRIVDTTITVADETIYFIESTSPKAISNTSGRLSILDMFDGGTQYLVSLDCNTGRVRYKQQLDMADFQQPVYLAHAQGILLLSGSRITGGEQIRTGGLSSVSQLKGGERIDYCFRAFDAMTGETRWDACHATDLPVRGGHGEYNRHPTIVGNRVYTYPYAYELRTGRRIDGWKFDRHGHGCGNISASEYCLFWRGNHPWLYDLRPNGGPRQMNQVTRPGCFINIIPAGGLVLIPEASSGCTCDYPMQMSLAYAPVANQAFESDMPSSP
ncbi:MAG: PQQ-binding-like beta-propeller repeat protein [Pirellulales bacterium]|nr:PQQ-binding-like beta-propeller repeat protein [Pirellulales bacterium]